MNVEGTQVTAIATRGLAVLTLLIAGCASLAKDEDLPIAERYQVSEKASAECISAAKRASRWCASREKEVWSDHEHSVKCTEAQWDYHRFCR
jgi:hypothetical protein